MVFFRFSCLFRLVDSLCIQPIDRLSLLLVVLFFRCCFRDNRLCHWISEDISFRCISMVSQHRMAHDARFGLAQAFESAHSPDTESVSLSGHESRMKISENLKLSCCDFIITRCFENTLHLIINIFYQWYFACVDTNEFWLFLKAT